VPVNSIGINEGLDASLQRTFAQVASHFCWGDCDGSAIFTVEVSKLESLKKRRPTGIEGIGIFLPTLVILLEQIEIQASGE